MCISRSQKFKLKSSMNEKISETSSTRFYPLLSGKLFQLLFIELTLDYPIEIRVKDSRKIF